jgi:hypothetical protein
LTYFVVSFLATFLSFPLSEFQLFASLHFHDFSHLNFSGPALEALREFLEEVERNNGVKVETEYPQVYVMENNAFKFIHQVKQGLEYTNVRACLFINLCNNNLLTIFFRLTLNAWNMIGPCPEQNRLA